GAAGGASGSAAGTAGASSTGAGTAGGASAKGARKAGGVRQAWRSSRQAHQTVAGTISNDSLGDVAAHAAAASGWSQQFPQSPVGDLTSAEAKRKRAELRARLG